MRARLSEKDYYDFGNKWTLKSPPGWDQIVKEEKKIKLIADHGFKLVMSMTTAVIAVFLAYF